MWIKKNLLSKKDLKVLEDRISSFWCWNWNWTIAAQNSIRLWWLHGVSVEELDIDLFHDLSKRSFTRNSFKMFADVCSCLPVSLYSSSIQDRHYKSWSAIFQFRWKIWKPAVFWFFSFERFNGILGTMQVNGRSVEIQLMRKLIAGRFFWDVKFPNEFHEHFLPFFCNFFPKMKVMIYLRTSW